jgi:hypothetical protein
MFGGACSFVLRELTCDLVQGRWGFNFFGWGVWVWGLGFGVLGFGFGWGGRYFGRAHACEQ